MTVARYTLDTRGPDATWRATDEHLKRQVLLKPWWAPTDRDRLCAKVATLANLQCNYIADVYDLFDVGAKTAVVEEHVDGLSLPEWEAGRALTESSVLRVLVQMSGALVQLHAEGLSPPSVAASRWRFDAEDLLNLTVFTTTDSGHRGEPEPRGPERMREDLRGVASHAKRFAETLTSLGEVFPSKTDAALSDLWAGTLAALTTAATWHRRLQACLVRDQHRAVVIHQGRSAELNASRRTLKLIHPTAGVAEATIRYDGIAFSIVSASGEVYLNNIPVTAPEVIPGSCVLTLGSPMRSWSERHFVTFDASHPEIVF